LANVRAIRKHTRTARFDARTRLALVTVIALRLHVDDGFVQFDAIIGRTRQPVTYIAWRTRTQRVTQTLVVHRAVERVVARGSEWLELGHACVVDTRDRFTLRERRRRALRGNIALSCASVSNDPVAVVIDCRTANLGYRLDTTGEQACCLVAQHTAGRTAAKRGLPDNGAGCSNKRRICENTRARGRVACICSTAIIIITNDRNSNNRAIHSTKVVEAAIACIRSVFECTDTGSCVGALVVNRTRNRVIACLSCLGTGQTCKIRSTVRIQALRAILSAARVAYALDSTPVVYHAVAVVVDTIRSAVFTPRRHIAIENSATYGVVAFDAPGSTSSYRWKSQHGAVLTNVRAIREHACAARFNACARLALVTVVALRLHVDDGFVQFDAIIRRTGQSVTYVTRRARTQRVP
jgi:hypothetical protein